MFRLSAKSKENLRGVHPKLCEVVNYAIMISDVDFAVIEGVRSVERQKQLVEAGASRTMKSRHLTGHAVDLAAIVGNEIRWDWPLYPKIADAMKKAALSLDVKITWGGDWVSLKDGPHFELNSKEYP